MYFRYGQSKTAWFVVEVTYFTCRVLTNATDHRTKQNHWSGDTPVVHDQLVSQPKIREVTKVTSAFCIPCKQKKAFYEKEILHFIQTRQQTAIMAKRNTLDKRKIMLNLEESTQRHRSFYRRVTQIQTTGKKW